MGPIRGVDFPPAQLTAGEKYSSKRFWKVVVHIKGQHKDRFERKAGGPVGTEYPVQLDEVLRRPRQGPKRRHVAKARSLDMDRALSIRA